MYNGKEFEEALDLNMSEMTFRQYDPAIGRFNVPDLLSELAPHMTPYRFAFNNPIYFSDPTGLFESRREARLYRRANGLRGRIKKQDDGTYAINGRDGNHYQAGDDSGFSNDNNPNDGVVQSVNVVADLSDIADAKQARINDFKRKFRLQQEHDRWMLQYGKSPYVDINSKMQAIGNMAEIAGLATAPIISSSSKAPAAVDISEDVAVYISKTANGSIQYVGITNNMAIRAAQHLKAKGINIEPLLQGLSRADAKAVEQVLIEIYGLGGKTGQTGQLLNKINSIAKSNPVYAESLKRGRELLKSIGY